VSLSSNHSGSQRQLKCLNDLQASVVFPPEFRRLREIRQDMEKLRLLTGLVHKRELTKRDYTHS
jgi:hypothetical protein